MPPRKPRPRPSNVKLTPTVTALIVIALILAGTAVYTFGSDSRLSTANVFNSAGKLDSGCIATNLNTYVESIRIQIPDKDRHTWIHLNVERLGFPCSSSKDPGWYEDFLRIVFPDNGELTFPVDGILKGLNPININATVTATTTGTSSSTPTPRTIIKEINYKDFVIIIDNGIYYVDDIPHDSIKAAKETIDATVAENESPTSPTVPTVGAVGVVVAVIAILLLAIRRKK